MKSLYRVDLPTDVGGVDALSLTQDGRVLVVSSAAELWQQSAGQPTALRIPVTIGGAKASVWDVMADSTSRLWVVASGADNTQLAGTLGAGQPELAKVDTGKREPRRLAWSAAGSALWFTATDTTLNTLHRGQVSTEKDVRFNTIVASPDGTRIVTRRIGDSAVLERAHGSSAEWTVRRRGFEGQVVAVANDGTLVLLELGLWRIGAKKADPGRLLLLSPAGHETVVRTGPIVRAAARANRLAIAEQGPKALTLEVLATD